MGQFMSLTLEEQLLLKTSKYQDDKNTVLLFMFSMLGYGIYKANGSIKGISFAVFRLIIMSTVVGTLLGIFFKPRSWCQVCPMGHITGVISKNSNKGDSK